MPLLHIVVLQHATLLQYVTVRAGDNERQKSVKDSALTQPAQENMTDTSTNTTRKKIFRERGLIFASEVHINEMNDLFYSSA